MKSELAQALLMATMEWREADDVENRPYLQAMARYKYDDYQQYRPGMRFIERLSLWLRQFKTIDEKRIALEFVKKRLVYFSTPEINNLVENIYVDKVKNILINKIAAIRGIPEYRISEIVDSNEFNALKRQCLFLGLSDGARTEVFRRNNTGTISHEQIYQTYELSNNRAEKMKEELRKDLSSKEILDREPTEEELKFKKIFLLDDFSASGKSYIQNRDGEYKGKISAFYKELLKREDFKKLFDLSQLDVYFILYICTNQAYNYLNTEIKNLWDKSYPCPTIIPIYKLDEQILLADNKDESFLGLCMDDEYYDKEALEDEHTKKGGDHVKLGFGHCRLPIILSHNAPNNSVSLLWSYDNASFKGLFPRVPRHTALI